jgi:rhamnogalacturonan endolyase
MPDGRVCTYSANDCSVADVDGDGEYEIILKWDPSNAHDNSHAGYTGTVYFDCLKLDGTRLWRIDMGKNIRAGAHYTQFMAADIDPTNEGLEMWSANSGGVRNVKGELILPTEYEEPTMDENKRRGMSTNFGIWWDGDLLRELLDHETVQKYDWKTGRVNVIKRFDGRFNNGTKSNPCLSGDILGDWREEVLVRDAQSTMLKLYTTDIPTDHRITCLMQDVPYRLSIATENVAYNQPPEPGFYLGVGMKK